MRNPVLKNKTRETPKVFVLKKWKNSSKFIYNLKAVNTTLALMKFWNNTNCNLVATNLFIK